MRMATRMATRAEPIVAVVIIMGPGFETGFGSGDTVGGVVEVGVDGEVVLGLVAVGVGVGEGPMVVDEVVEEGVELVAVEEEVDAEEGLLEVEDTSSLVVVACAEDLLEREVEGFLSPVSEADDDRPDDDLDELSAEVEVEVE